MKLKRHEPPCFKIDIQSRIHVLYKLHTILCPHLLHKLWFSEPAFKNDRTTCIGVSLAIIKYERWFTAALNFDGIYELSVEKKNKLTLSRVWCAARSEIADIRVRFVPSYHPLAVHSKMGKQHSPRWSCFSLEIAIVLSQSALEPTWM